MESLNTKKTVNKVNNKATNKANNVSKIAETKAINLLNEVKKQADKETKEQEQEQKKQDKLARLKQETLEKGNYNRVVNGTNKIFKTNFVSLGYLLKIVSNEQEQVIQEQKQDVNFNEYDEIKLNKVFEIIKLARKNSDLYKAINECKGIKSKKGNYCVYYLIRTINTNINDLNKLIQLQNWK
jgi:hypothetical protein